MSKQLYILRHGKSDWPADVEDFNRPLKKRGIKAVKKLGYWLANSHTKKPDVVITSPAERAITTALLITDKVDIKELVIDERLYQADLEQLLSVLSELPEEAKRVMLVGHNPGLEELLIHLASVPAKYYRDSTLLTTGTLAIIKIGADWNALEPQSGKFKKLVRGKDL